MTAHALPNAPSTADESRNLHTISLLVANKPGVLVRVSLVFARRGYNIESLVVSPALKTPGVTASVGDYSRMTITCSGDQPAPWPSRLCPSVAVLRAMAE